MSENSHNSNDVTKTTPTTPKSPKKQTDLRIVDTICKIMIVLLCSYGYYYMTQSFNLNREARAARPDFKFPQMKEFTLAGKWAIFFSITKLVTKKFMFKLVKPFCKD